MPQPLTNAEYANIAGTFYDEQTDAAKVGWFRAWYHSTRYTRLADTVASLYRPGDFVLDVACGSCVWNTRHLPVTGLDVNASMQCVARDHGRLSAAIVASMTQAGLRDASVDLIVSSEVLEHIRDKDLAVSEFSRLLKPGGRLVLTVPYDRPLTPFFFMFNAQCLYQGWVKGDPYYRHFCGHVNHFSPRAIRDLLARYGLRTARQFVHNTFLIYTVAERI